VSDDPGAAASERRAWLAQVRHELRNPVNAIIGYGEMLLEDAADLGHAGFRSALQKLHALARESSALIGELLDPGRLEAAPDVRAFCGRTAQQLQAPARQLTECCRDLLGQATELSLEGFLPDLQRIQTAGQRLLALIGDQLQGGAPAPRRPVGGREPAADAPPARPEQPDAEPAYPPWLEEPPSARRGHVLVVDDNPFNRDLLARGLLRQGHHFALASNGRIALDMLESLAFDVVLLDIMMPELDGHQVLARLKADPRLRHVPVIMISAADEIDRVVRCIEDGAEDFLAKPFNPVLLRARVDACLEKKRLRDQELEYLRQVEAVTAAAAAVEAGAFREAQLEEVAGRPDALGRLARVFRQMAHEVRAREERLQQQVRQLRVQVDEARKARQVAEITETGYFQELQQKAALLRKRLGKAPE
jgi:CheY-like chemotaxis protein